MNERARVILTPLRESDREVLFEWINDRSNALWNAAYRPVQPTAHDKWFDGLGGRADMVIFAIRSGPDSRLLGTCQLHSIDAVHRSAELQIRIGQPADHGKGHGTEAVRLLIEFGFRDLNLERIQLHVFKKNLRAIAVYEKNGFIREGIARHAAFVDGSYQDVVLMGLLRHEQWSKDGKGP